MTRPGDHAAEVQSCRETLSTRTTLSSSISGQQNAVRRARRRSIKLCPYLNEVLIKKQVRISTSCLISCSPNTRNISLPVGLASRRSCCGRSSTKSNKPPNWSYGPPSSHLKNHAHRDFNFDPKDHSSAEVRAQNAHRKAREVYHTRVHAVHAHSDESPPISNPRVAGLCRELGILELKFRPGFDRPPRPLKVQIQQQRDGNTPIIDEKPSSRCLASPGAAVPYATRRSTASRDTSSWPVLQAADLLRLLRGLPLGLWKTRVPVS
ncbi:hypothetical protein C7M84_001660, partial [Penaeus vannamei]